MTDKTAPKTIPIDFLIKASDKLAEDPGFSLIGRQPDLDAAADVLMRKDGRNNLVIYGQNGVGISSILLGLEASKKSLDTPFDIVTKRFYYLDVDGLFSSGNAEQINEGFQKAMTTLLQAKDSVLIIENTKDFLDGIANHGVANLMNILIREAKANKKFQVIFETQDDSLGSLFKAHTEIPKIFTLQQIREPSKEALLGILHDSAKELSSFHGIGISEDAIQMVAGLTLKYPGLTLNMAQPQRSVTILEGALTAYRRKAHTQSGELEELNKTLAEVTNALEGKKSGIYADKTPEELAALKITVENDLKEVTSSWEERQKKLRQVYMDQQAAEDMIIDINRQISAVKEGEEYKKKMQQAYAKAADDAAREKIKDDYHAKTGEDFVEADPERSIKGSFNANLTLGKFSSEAVATLEKQRSEYEKAAAENKALYESLTKDINENLSLNSEHILAEFSRLSGVPMNKLKQNETDKLLSLEDTVRKRIFGQEEPVKAVVEAIKRARTGVKDPKKPIGSFIFLGPSGVGKTELAKALADAWFGEETAMDVYNMPEYGEEHAVSTLIGAPPGYEGYDAGGTLTNNMNRQPYKVNVFDEMEKAHKKVYDIFLQIIDEGKVTDRRGVPSYFSDSINIFTSNVGAKYFLDETLTFEQAKEKAIKDLFDPETGFRPEFLNRFSGIFCFNRLGQPEIQLIAGKFLKKLNGWLADKGISVEIAETDLKAMCEDQYDIKAGGRSIERYIMNTVGTEASNAQLLHPDRKGVLKVHYTRKTDKEAAKLSLEFVDQGAASAAPAPVEAAPTTPPAVDLKAPVPKGPAHAKAAA